MPGVFAELRPQQRGVGSMLNYAGRNVPDQLGELDGVLRAF